MKRKKLITLVFVSMVMLLLSSHISEAATIRELLHSGADSAGIENTYRNDADLEGVSRILINALQVVLGFIGIVFMIYMTYAGFLWLTAAGSDEKSKRAKTIITQAVIGLVIILLSMTILYTITSLIEGSFSIDSSNSNQQPLTSGGN